MRDDMGWGLPPGCTEADIDRRFGDEPEEDEREVNEDLEDEEFDRE